jgi:predicted transcriptional regulator
MKTTSLTIRIDKKLDKLLEKTSQQTGKSKSQVAREAIERQLRLFQMENLRKRIMPFAESRGYLTDDDVFREVS